MIDPKDKKQVIASRDWYFKATWTATTEQMCTIVALQNITRAQLRAGRRLSRAICRQPKKMVLP